MLVNNPITPSKYSMVSISPKTSKKISIFSVENRETKAQKEALAELSRKPISERAAMQLWTGAVPEYKELVLSAIEEIIKVDYDDFKSGMERNRAYANLRQASQIKGESAANLDRYNNLIYSIWDKTMTQLEDPRSTTKGLRTLIAIYSALDDGSKNVAATLISERLMAVDLDGFCRQFLLSAYNHELHTKPPRESYIELVNVHCGNAVDFSKLNRRIEL